MDKLKDIKGARRRISKYICDGRFENHFVDRYCQMKAIEEKIQIRKAGRERVINRKTVLFLAVLESSFLSLVNNLLIILLKLKAFLLGVDRNLLNLNFIV